ncbi:MAG: OpcA/G6PD domain-containing protein, partial [Ilumatobacteraceae bacterium]
MQVSRTSALGAGLDRRRCEHDERAGRIAALTLLVLLDAPDAVGGVVELVRQVAPATPTNAIIVIPSSGTADRHDSSATLSLVTLGAFGQVATCVEDVVLRIDGVRDPGDVDTAVVGWILDTFARPGLPIVTWMPGRLPAADHPAVTVAERILVDSHVLDAAASPADRPGILPALLSLGRSRTVVDLAWVRLEPWRRLTAGWLLGDDRLRAVTGRHIAEITVDVEGEPVTATLLAGWLAGGLASEPDRHRVTVRSRNAGRTRL